MKKPLSQEHKAKIADGLKRIGWRGGMLGKKHSLETREKMRKSASHPRAAFSENHKENLKKSHIGQIPWNKGKKLGPMSVENRRKHMGIMTGAKNPAWKGGVTPIHRSIRTSGEYKIWRLAVFERDKYTCVWCNSRGVVLNADHIKPFAYFPELRFAIDNGRTLCVPCHKTTDTYARALTKIRYEK